MRYIVLPKGKWVQVANRSRGRCNDDPAAEYAHIDLAQTQSRLLMLTSVLLMVKIKVLAAAKGPSTPGRTTATGSARFSWVTKNEKADPLQGSAFLGMRTSG